MLLVKRKTYVYSLGAIPMHTMRCEIAPVAMIKGWS